MMKVTFMKKIINAAEIPDNKKKQIIFDSLNELDFGEELVIHNTHNTAPLIKLLKREKPGQYNYMYLKEGPGIWEIKISRKDINEYKIGDLIAINPGSIFIFSKLGIDFYAHYDNLIINLLLNKRAILSDVINEAISYKSEVFKSIKPELWTPSFIIDFIIQNHHFYLNKKLPELSALIHHLEKNQGASNPQFQRLKEKFSQFVDEITEHLEEEEKIIFPAIRKIEKIKSKLSKTQKEELSEKLNWMQEDHYLTGDSFSSFRKLCNNYHLNEDDIPGMKLLYEEFEELETDFALHILFENHFLIQSINRNFSN